MRFVVGTFAFLFCGALHAHAQAQQQPQQSNQVLHAQTIVVTVPTEVSDSHGNRIWALQADDFAITDDGVPQKVYLDDSPIPPARAIAIVVQNNDDTYLLEDSLNEALRGFLEALPEGEIPLVVVTAGTKAKVIVPFTSNREEVQSQLSRLEPDADSGGPKLLDGVYMAAKMLQENYANRQKIVLLVSGAHDGDSAGKLMSVLPGGKSADAKAKKARWNSSHSSQEVLQYVELNNVVVDAIEFNRYGLGASDYWKNTGLSSLSLNPISLLFHAGDWIRKDVPRNLAEATGGEVRNVSKKRGVSNSALRIAGDVAAVYQLSFHPKGPAPGLHEIRVTTPGRPRLRVRNRAFYWAQNTTPK